jgi:hypothetical protein
MESIGIANVGHHATLESRFEPIEEKEKFGLQNMMYDKVQSFSIFYPPRSFSITYDAWNVSYLF